MRSGTTRCSTGRRRVDALDRRASRSRRRRSGRPSAAASGRGRRSPARGRRCRSRSSRGRARPPSAGSRWPHAGEVQPDVAADAGRPAPRRRGSRARRATTAPSRCRPVDVHVEAARADRVAAGQGDVGLAAASHQRAEHADRGAHRGARGRSRPGGAGAPARRWPTTPASGSWTTVQPSRRSSSAMIRRRGCRARRMSVVVPSASSAAAMSLSTLFLAPVTRTVALEPGPTDDPERFHGASMVRPPPVGLGTAARCPRLMPW